MLAGIYLLSALLYLPANLLDAGAVTPPAVTVVPSVLAMVLAVVVVYLLWRPASTQYYDEVSRRSAPVPQASPVGQALPAGEVAPPRPSGTSGLAIASLILGILGLFLVTAVLAIIFGVIALRETRRSGQGGRGLAIAGISIAAVWLAILALGVVGSLVEDSEDVGGTDPTPAPMTAADQPPPPDTPIVGQVDLIPPGVDGSALGLGQVLRQGEALRLRLVAEGLELEEEVVTEEPRRHRVWRSSSRAHSSPRPPEEPEAQRRVSCSDRPPGALGCRRG